ncbi:hypothetical protein AA313_de0201603 [Arthrobotrys entomopaga]|nr:hypothetical protein AA313_de0201603 [Arthrobotrys entomopaga]
MQRPSEFLSLLLIGTRKLPLNNLGLNRIASCKKFQSDILSVPGIPLLQSLSSFSSSLSSNEPNPWADKYARSSTTTSPSLVRDPHSRYIIATVQPPRLTKPAVHINGLSNPPSSFLSAN